MRAKTVIYYKPNGEIQKILSNAGQTRHIKAANLLLYGQVKPTLGMRILGLFSKPHRAQRRRKKNFAKKLHGFFISIRSEVAYHADNIAVNPIVGSQAAADGVCCVFLGRGSGKTERRAAMLREVFDNESKAD